MSDNLKISVGELQDSKYQIVKFNGEFDKAGFSAIKEQLKETVEAFAGKSLIFDFAALKFINSEAIGYLMDLHSKMKKAGKGLVIVNLRENVKDVFDAIGIKEVIPVYSSVSAFLKG